MSKIIKNNVIINTDHYSQHKKKSKSNMIKSGKYSLSYIIIYKLYIIIISIVYHNIIW